jgi:6-phosphogluconolactonase
VVHKPNNAPERRDFLKLAGLAAMGVTLPKLGLARASSAESSGELLVYVGTYTTGKSEGIYLYRLNLSSGELKHVATTRGVINPSFLALAPSRRFLYSVNEVEEFGGQKSGAVSAFAVDRRTGELRFINQQPSLGGAPCYVDVDTIGKFVLIANYVGGNVVVLPAKRDGSLGPAIDMKQAHGSRVNKERQESPHAHCIVLDQANRFAYSCDLGTDKIMIFRFDARSGKLRPTEQPWVQVKPGSGPRHLAFHPSGKYLFVLNELDSTVTAFSRDQGKGSLIGNCRPLSRAFILNPLLIPGFRCAPPQALRCHPLRRLNPYLLSGIDVRRLNILRNKLAIDQVFHADRSFKNSCLNCHVIDLL